jgi:hypothetical protein
MVRKAKRGAVIVYLADVVALAKDTVAPSGYASFLGGIVCVGPQVVFVGGEEGDACFGVVRECQAGDHLEVKLVMLTERCC